MGGLDAGPSRWSGGEVGQSDWRDWEPLGLSDLDREEGWCGRASQRTALEAVLLVGLGARHPRSTSSRSDSNGPTGEVFLRCVRTWKTSISKSIAGLGRVVFIRSV